MAETAEGSDGDEMEDPEKPLPHPFEALALYERLSARCRLHPHQELCGASGVFISLRVSAILRFYGTASISPVSSGSGEPSGVTGRIRNDFPYESNVIVTDSSISLGY